MEKQKCSPCCCQGHFKAGEVRRSCKNKHLMICPQRDSFQLFWQHLKKEDAMLSSLCLCLEIVLILCCYTATIAHLNFKAYSSQGKFPEWLSQKKQWKGIIFFYYSLNQIPRDIVCQCQFRAGPLTYGALKQERTIQTDLQSQGKRFFELKNFYTVLMICIWYAFTPLSLSPINCLERICSILVERQFSHFGLVMK